MYTYLHNLVSFIPTFREGSLGSQTEQEAWHEKLGTPGNVARALVFSLPSYCCAGRPTPDQF